MRNPFEHGCAMVGYGTAARRRPAAREARAPRSLVAERCRAARRAPPHRDIRNASAGTRSQHARRDAPAEAFRRLCADALPLQRGESRQGGVCRSSLRALASAPELSCREEAAPLLSLGSRGARAARGPAFPAGTFPPAV